MYVCDAREQCSRAPVLASAHTGGQEVPSHPYWSFLRAPVYSQLPLCCSPSAPVKAACWTLRVIQVCFHSFQIKATQPDSQMPVEAIMFPM